MAKPIPRPRFHSETGGITILVALMLLVLLTIAAIGMSRNSFREIVSSGTTRQGAMVRNTADAGVEWSIYWLDIANAGSGSPPASAVSMKTLKDYLLQNDSKSGVAYDVLTQTPYSGPPAISAISDGSDWTMVVPNPATNNNTKQAYSIALTRMGKLPITDISQGTTQGTFSPAQGGVSKQAPDLWAVRSDAQVQVGTGLLSPNFQHSKEAWISTPVQ
jgi:hypothetical protein